MTMIPDNELRTECFQLLVDRFVHLVTERFIVMINRSPMDYTTWHQRHFSNGESVRELGEKIKAFAKTLKATA